MNINDFVTINRNSGYTIKKIDGQYFLNRGLINYSFPQLVETPINKKLVTHLKWRYLISIVKTNSWIKNTYEFILTVDDYPVELFPHRTRTTVRKSLKSCTFKRPTLEDLKVTGLDINRQTLKIQKRSDKNLTDKNRWEKQISQLYNNQDVKILGAYVDGKLIGFAIAYEMEGKHYFHIQHIDRDQGSNYPMSGLMYLLINQIIEEKGAIEISDGIESFEPLPTLNKFKRYMRFERVPITRAYILHPVLVAFIVPLIVFYIRVLKKRNINNPFVRKIISLYQGHRMLSKIVS
jgi:hypothetical protein